MAESQNDKLKKKLASPNYIDARYPRDKDYACANHPDEPAFALCARCGKLLCHSCSSVVESRSLCSDCIQDDDAFRALLENDTPTYAQTQARADNAFAVPEAAKSVKDLPKAVRNQIRTGPLFYKTVMDTPFWVSFIVAFVAFLPTSLYNAILNLTSEESLKQTEKMLTSAFPADVAAQTLESIKNLSILERIGMGLVSTAMIVLLLDCFFYFSMKFVIRADFRFVQTSSALHFCMLPILFMIFQAAWGWSILGWLGIILATLNTTTAMHVTTKCSFLRGLFGMLVFICMSSFLFN